MWEATPCTALACDFAFELLGLCEETLTRGVIMVETYTAADSPINVSSGETFSNKLLDQSNGAVVVEAYGSEITIRNVGWQGVHSGETNILKVAVPDGRGAMNVENCYLGDGQRACTKGGGIWVHYDPQHNGTINFRNIHVANMAGNALYGSAPGYHGQNGETNVFNSYFKDNNISNIRLGNPNSNDVVRDTMSVANPSNIRGWSGDCRKGIRGVWSYQGVVRVDNCDVRIGMTNNFLSKVFAGNVNTVNTRTQGNANTRIPNGVPRSAQEAAQGGSTSLDEIINLNGENEIAIRPE